jgi:hypothetical protein
MMGVFAAKTHKLVKAQKMKNKIVVWFCWFWETCQNQLCRCTSPDFVEIGGNGEAILQGSRPTAAQSTVTS